MEQENHGDSQQISGGLGRGGEEGWTGELRGFLGQ